MVANVVLIVEDDRFIQQMYEKMFTFEKFSVVTASDGVEGLAKAKTAKPSVILLDIMMPNMSGMDVLDKLKSDATTKDIPVIMLTNLGGDSDIKAAMEKGAAKYIIKSEYDPKEVTELVKKVIAEHSPKA